MCCATYDALFSAVLLRPRLLHALPIDSGLLDIVHDVYPPRRNICPSVYDPPSWLNTRPQIIPSTKANPLPLLELAILLLDLIALVLVSTRTRLTMPLPLLLEILFPLLESLVLV